MILYIIRHGQAEIHSASGHDADRELVEHGHLQAAAIAEFLLDRDEQCPSRIIASPYARAQQTAGSIWSSLGIDHETDDRLAADRSASDIMNLLADQPTTESIGIVGHNPTVSRLADILISGTTAKSQFSMRTGELICMRINPQSPAASAQLIAQFRLGDSHI
ncbi:MAG: histidine phosphatase family protein [Phycisphaerales bacterium]